MRSSSIDLCPLLTTSEPDSGMALFAPLSHDMPAQLKVIPTVLCKPDMHMFLLCCLTTGPFYLTLTGPGEAFPDLSDPAKMTAVKASVKGALNLDSAYPLSNIMVWIENRQEVTPAGRRHLLNNNKVVILVLGYALVRTDQLPPAAELVTKTEACTQQIAVQLEQQGFVTPEQLGLLSVIVTTVNKVSAVVNAILGIPGVDALILVPIGKPQHSIRYLTVVVGCWSVQLAPMLPCSQHLCTPKEACWHMP